MASFQNARVVITGSGSGLGRAFARRFAERGASMVLADIDEKGNEETLAELRRGGARAFVERADVSKLADVERLAEVAERHLGGVDVIVNNAGVAVAGKVGDIPMSDWEWIMGINLWGVIYGCHVFAPRFRKQSSGAIINVASLAAVAQAPDMAPYNVTKAAVVSLSETLAAELAEANVSVTVLCPSFFPTSIHKNARTTAMPHAENLIEKLMGRSKLDADDVAEIAIGKCEAGVLYAMPHLESKVLWRVKRLLPGVLHQRILPRAARRMRG